MPRGHSHEIESAALAGQFSLPMGEMTVVHDLMSSRADGLALATLMSNDPLWKAIPEKQHAAFLDWQNGKSVLMHPHALTFEKEIPGTIPYGQKHLGGIAIVTDALVPSDELSRRIGLLRHMLGKEGVILVMEAAGDNRDRLWRTSALRAGGFVDSYIYVHGDPILWHARREKKADRKPVDLIEKWQNSDGWRREHFPKRFARILAGYAARGYRVKNTDAIVAKLRSTKNIPGDLRSFHDGYGVVILDKYCGCEIRVALNGDRNTLRACHNPEAHEEHRSPGDLWRERKFQEEVKDARIVRYYSSVPSEGVLREQCLDCYGGVLQTVQEIGDSPVGHLYYITRQCPEGQWFESSIGVVEITEHL